MSQHVVVGFLLKDDVEVEHFLDRVRETPGVQASILMVDAGGGFYVEREDLEDPGRHDRDLIEYARDHEEAHQAEREGGEHVDRRECQAIGCKYGDH